jgi:hypothetical protein
MFVSLRQNADLGDEGEGGEERVKMLISKEWVII